MSAKTELTYTEPKARTARRLAALPEFQDENGQPSHQLIAQRVGLPVPATRYVVSDELPEGVKEEPKRGRAAAKEMLS